MNLYSVFPFLSFLFNTILASVVLGLNPHSRTNQAYSAFAYDFALWAFLNFAECHLHSPHSLSFFAFIEPLAWLPATFLVLNFIYVLVKRPPDLPFKIFGVAVFGWMLFSALTGALVDGFKSLNWGEMILVTDLYFVAIAMTTLLPAAWGFYILFKTIKTTKDPSFKVHLQYLTAGTVLMYAVVIFDSVFKSALFRIDSFPSYGSFLLIIQSAFVFLAIIRHRFLNIDLRDIAHEIFYRVNECVVILDMDQSVCFMNESTGNFFGNSNIDKKNITSLFGEHYKFDNTINNLEITCVNNEKSKIGLLSQSNLYSRNILIGKLVLIRDITISRDDQRKRIMLENQVQQMNAARLEALGKLAGGIAHDFNNILSVISGSATLLRMNLLRKDPTLLAHAESIIKTSQDASVLTKKMLTFASHNIPETATVNCHETITDVVTMLKHSIDKFIIVTTDLSAEKHCIIGDRIQIQNMLLNISINACDAMPKGGNLHFSTRNDNPAYDFVMSHNPETPGGDYLVIDIKDTGIGMTNEIKNNIFEPFFTTKQRGKGTGLGLATAYGTSLAHKGFIAVDSDLGSGTVFHIFFPVINSKQLEITDKSPEINNGNGKILLVDDEDKIRYTTAEMLKSIGYTIITSSNGEDAVRIYAENPGIIDLVLLDIMMPVMNGIQCAEKLKKINPDIKIIFISGYSGTSLSTEPETAVSPLNSTNFIYKPFTIEQLSQTIKEIIDNNFSIQH